MKLLNYMKTSLSNSETYLVVIGAGEFQLPIIQRAIKRGIKVIGIDGNPNAIGLKHCTISLIIDVMNHELIVSSLRTLNLKIDGVLNLAVEVAVVSVAQVAEEFKLKGVSLDAAFICTNKYLMRKCFKKKNRRFINRFK